jgi:hypothetical protein
MSTYRQSVPELDTNGELADYLLRVAKVHLTLSDLSYSLIVVVECLCVLFKQCDD